MPKDYVQIAHEVTAGIGALRQAVPPVMKAFGELAKAATAPGAIDTKTKELMAVAIGMAAGCDGCIGHHVRMARRHGATREEVAETIALSIYMGGGPASVRAAEVLQAYDQLAAAEEHT